MEDLDSATMTTTKPKATVPRDITAALVIVGVILGSALGTVSGWKLRGAHDASSSLATTAVHGMLTLPDSGITSTGSGCAGSGGYNDISGGTAVTIGDQTGKTLAITALSAGNYGGGGCQFTFSAQVAAATSYTVTISHRGTQVFPASDIATGFNLTLGG